MGTQGKCRLLLSLCPIDNSGDVPVSTCVADASWTISCHNCGIFFAVQCLVKAILALFTCLTGQLSLCFWYVLTFSSLFPRCCQTHDQCYGQAQKLAACRSLVDNPYTASYKFSCSQGQITCSSTSASKPLCFKRHCSLSFDGTGLLHSMEGAVQVPAGGLVLEEGHLTWAPE